MTKYKAALIGCSRMGAFIDNEVPARMRPYSHAAGYEACERVDLIACSDVRKEVMEQVGERYRIPPEKQYVDYQQMLKREKPDIVSVATQPEHRTDIVIWAAENGTKAIYAEKALSASLEEADRIVEACEAKGVILNLGTNRRWDPGYDTIKEIIESGRIGALKSLIHHSTSTLFNGASHSFDVLQRLNNDVPATSVQAELLDGDDAFEGDILRQDPVGHGIIKFANGVTAYALESSRGHEIEAICELGVATALINGNDWQLRIATEKDYRGRDVLAPATFPEFEARSSTLVLIEDLVHALDSGEPPRGGVRVARANMELIFAFVESHARGGARVDLPLEASKYRLERQRGPAQPKYQPIAE